MRAFLAIVLMILAAGAARQSIALGVALAVASLWVMARADTASESRLMGATLLATLAVIALGVAT